VTDNAAWTSTAGRRGHDGTGGRMWDYDRRSLDAGGSDRPRNSTFQRSRHHSAQPHTNGLVGYQRSLQQRETRLGTV
jgi:hypothetical protein